jgi:hypothetical protein
MTTGLPGPDAASGSRNPPLNYYGEQNVVPWARLRMRLLMSA